MGPAVLDALMGRVFAADGSVRVQRAGFGGKDSVRERGRSAGFGRVPAAGARGRDPRVPGRFAARRSRIRMEG